MDAEKHEWATTGWLDWRIGDHMATAAALCAHRTVLRLLVSVTPSSAFLPRTRLPPRSIITPPSFPSPARLSAAVAVFVMASRPAAAKADAAANEPRYRIMQRGHGRNVDPERKSEITDVHMNLQRQWSRLGR